MAQNYTANLPEDTWTQLTNADISSITFQNKSGFDEIFIAGAVGEVQPTDFAGAIRYKPGMGESNRALSDLFPGIAATRVYAYCARAAEVFVSHA